MKIGLVNDYSPATGIGNYAFSLFSELKGMEKDIDMLYLQYKEPLEVLDKRIKVIETPFKLPVLTKTLNWYYYFPKKIPEGYDIYHVSSQYLSKVAKYRKPCVVSCMDIFPIILKNDYPFLLHFFTKRVSKYMKKADHIIAISNFTKRKLIEELNIPEGKIDVIYLGADDETFSPLDKKKARAKLNLPLDQKIILHIGSEEPRKNVPTVINAFNRVQKNIPDSLLIMVGEKTEMSENLIKKYNMQKKIIYKNNISREELLQYYNSSDLFVYPSLYEGFGLPILEAMACGIPVIASNTGSLPEVVGDGGIMLDPFDIEAISDNMYEILTNESIRENIIKKGLERAKLFSWKKTAEETLTVYEKVMK